MTEEILGPPMLARGNWPSDAGVGCIMNLMCWVKGVDENKYGDHPPDMFDRFRQVLITFNDEMCIHLRYIRVETAVPNIFHFKDQPPKTTHNVYLNCPECSQKLIDWAFALSDSGWAQKTLLHNSSNSDHWQDLLRLERLLDVLDRVNDRLTTVTRSHMYFADDIPSNVGGEHFPKKWLPQYQNVMVDLDTAFIKLIECYQKLVEKYQPKQTQRMWLPLDKAIEKANFTKSVLSR